MSESNLSMGGLGRVDGQIVLTLLTPSGRARTVPLTRRQVMVLAFHANQVLLAEEMADRQPAPSGPLL